MGQLRYDIFKDPFDFYYFKRNLYDVGLKFLCKDCKLTFICFCNFILYKSQI